MDHSTQELTRLRQLFQELDADRAWDHSFARRAVSGILTYGVIVLFLNAAGIERPWTSAVVPTLSFLLTRASLPFLKGFWVKRFYRSRSSQP